MFKNLFSARRAADPAPVAAEDTATALPAAHAPGTEIKYHPDLIQRFAGHHASLRKLFDAIKTHATNNEFTAAVESMQSFRRVLTAHLLEENVKLYTYMSKCMANDADNRDLILSMKAEMGKIGGGVMQFLGKYITEGITPFTKVEFLKRLDETGEILADRLEQEETTLYTLYMPPDAFA